MDIDTAKEVRDQALKAIEELSHGLTIAKGKCSEEDFESLKKAVGMSIIRIDGDILDFIYTRYPELDDLKDTDKF